MKNVELVVACTDKSGNLCAISKEKYEAMGMIHTKVDKEINWAELEDTQRQLTGHTYSWLKITNAGANWEQQDRFRRSCLGKSNNPAKMNLLLKAKKCYSIYVISIKLLIVYLIAML